VSSLVSDSAVAIAIRRPRRLGLDRSIAGCFALATLLHVGVGPRGLLVACVVGILVELAAIDLERRILPNRIVVPALPGRARGPAGARPVVLLRDAPLRGGGGLFLLPAVALPPGPVGMGDVKLARRSSAARSGRSRRRPSRSAPRGGGLRRCPLPGAGTLRQEIPLGPFLAAGAIAAVLLS
jgi:prepilin signal peptidase PulO-like enzyme (type II secretory pathway)